MNQNRAKHPLMQAIASGRALLMDGAMGTELYAKGTFINKCFEELNLTSPALVVDARPVSEALADRRIAALLVGPGLGRDDTARWRLAVALASGAPVVLDADALALLHPGEVHSQAIATPHEGELAALESSFGLPGSGTRRYQRR